MSLTPINGHGEITEPQVGSVNSAIYFDGASSQRHAVLLAFSDRLEIRESGYTLAVWSYTDVRRADSPVGILRLACATAPALARLEIREPATAEQIVRRCDDLDASAPGGLSKIIGWSVAAMISIVVTAFYGVPLIADRLAPLVPQAFERRIGDVAEVQIKTLFDGKTCENSLGQAAFTKLVNAIRTVAELDTTNAPAVLSSQTPNAFALPGGKVFLLNGLLAKAESPDEIAGVLAHELGHLKHRDNMRGMLQAGGTSFLFGLLFGDITGSSALIFASRSIVNAAYSRDAEESADTFAIEVMHRLGRSPKKMGELLFRITGNEAGKSISILASHPFTEDRLARMTKEDRPPSRPPLLTPEEWVALKGICDPGSKT